MKYMLIAGEPSGDLHASQLIAALKEADYKAEFVFLGGDLMAEQAQCKPVIHYKDMAFMGFSEVFRNLRKIFRNLKIAKDTVASERPDAIILVDYPSFNLKVAKEAARLGIPCYWYISPKLWAWKAWRVKKIRKYVRKMLCILPFEPEWYARHGYNDAVYVGNPTVEELEKAIGNAPSREDFLAANRLRNRPIIALLPGSRRGEIKCNLPVMDAVARQFPQYTVAVAGAPNIPDEFYESLAKFKVVRGATHELLAHSHAALVTSGTATLETAVAGVPQVVMYRSNGSKVAYNLMKSMLHVKYVSLPNLIADAPVVPEMLLQYCTPQAVSDALRRLTPDNSHQRAEMLSNYNNVMQALGSKGAAYNSAETIIKDLEKN